MNRARRVALRFLCDVAGGRHVDALSQDREFNQLSREDRAFTRELVYGCLRQQLKLDYLLARLSSRPLNRLDPDVLRILRLGAYQIRLLRVPAHAAVHTSVELVHESGYSSARGLVNAVLRNLIRKPPKLPEGEAPAALAIRYSHPEWLVSRALGRWGPDRTRSWMEQNNEPPRGVFWVNPHYSSPQAFLSRMREQDSNCRLHPELPRAVYLEPSVQLPHEGRVECGFFMDEGSQRIVHRQLPKGVRRCLDLCAAPGGKAFLLACELPDEFGLIVNDLRRRRILQLRQRATALGFERLPLLRSDASTPPFPPACFDFILLDVPCTGLGTIRSNPDIRWRIVESDLKRFHDKQVALLEQALTLAKPGGRVVYSTCSTEEEENERVVERALGQSIGTAQLEETWRNFPGERSGDCFFRATLKRGE